MRPENFISLAIFLIYLTEYTHLYLMIVSVNISLSELSDIIMLIVIGNKVLFYNNKTTEILPVIKKYNCIVMDR